MEIIDAVSRPVTVRAVRYDGTMDTGDFLVTWVRPNVHQELYFEDDIHLVLHAKGETSVLYEGWWLVRRESDGYFEVLTDEEFKTKYTTR